jgi:hypothetical protein
MSLIVSRTLLAAALGVPRSKIRAAINEVRYATPAAKSIWLLEGLEKASFHFWNRRKVQNGGNAILLRLEKFPSYLLNDLAGRLMDVCCD